MGTSARGADSGGVSARTALPSPGTVQIGRSARPGHRLRREWAGVAAAPSAVEPQQADSSAGRHGAPVVAELSAAHDPELARWIAAEEWAARANPARVRLIRRAAGVGGGLLALTGLAVWVGWAIGSPTLTSVVPGLVTMKWWTAACFIVLGMGIALPTIRDTLAVRRIAMGLGLFVALLALTFLLEHATGGDLGHDNAFGLDRAAGADHPGRMSQTTALCFVLLGTSLALHKVGRVRVAQAIAVAPTAIGYLALVGYVFDVSPLYSAVSLASMAIHTAAALMVAGLAILALRSDEGFMAVFSINTAGGRVARRLVPAAILMPVTIGWALDVLVLRGVIDAPFALALMVTAVSVLGVAAIWREAGGLSMIDVQRAGTVAALRRVREAEARQTTLTAALEESARRTQAILDSALDAFIGLDRDGRITSWNPAAERLYGWSAVEAVGMRLDELLPVFRADGSVLTARVDGDFLEHAIRRGPAAYAVVRKDGTIAEVESRVWAQNARDGRTYTATVRDIAQRRRAERELLELNRSLDEFAAVAAHDLRGPIAAIRVNLELLAESAVGRGDENQLATVARMQSAADRGLTLIDDLLTYSRAGRSAIEPRRIDLTELVEAVADEVSERADRSSRIDIAPLPPIAGGAGTLRQVFANLFVNAIDYCPNDRVPHVRVTAEPAADRRQLLIRVTDNGDGVPLAERDRVFEMFQRGTTSAGRSGTGVGLALCLRVVERHGGNIWIENAPGGGTNMCITLPRHFDPPATSGARARQVPPPG
ncbi:PAS domain S-box-containing protein [Kineosphaera limosa]|uniref:Sensor-like histidine kinase SenX3 n=1 Tax=Kineosphaera limosa NBRC 100340 TaxID=1184609 RepID=K6W735_9MICO|nr:PAS domain-containing sensor histidine kinase [Kineosphaera limosa]NYE00529.1 PAS domain S-box-containing protein [Kineosphaera limosa]GAB95005.1 hypothetical protein KILIM_015_00660 [Kineosphaera limosa NBRC 100340]